VTGDSAPLHTALPPTVPGPWNSPGTSTRNAGLASTDPAAVAGSPFPAIVQAAYLDTQRAIAASDPGCHLSWTVLAGIGQVESGQADGGDVTPDGTTRTPILGPVLNGTGGNAFIPAPGGGWARAEGPMQFLPTTWAVWEADGNGDGRSDVNNVFDASLAAGHYLCAGGRDLARTGDLDAAILSYNHSPSYLATVTAWITYYQHAPTTGAPASPGTGPSGAPSTASPAPSTSPTPPPATQAPTSPPAGAPAGPSQSASPTGAPSQSASPSTTAGPSGSPTPTGPVCSTPSATPTDQGSSSPTPTNIPTPSPSPTDTASGSATPTPTTGTCPTPTDAADTSAPPSLSLPSS
jgi:hypothetical protein